MCGKLRSSRFLIAVTHGAIGKVELFVAGHFKSIDCRFLTHTSLERNETLVLNSKIPAAFRAKKSGNEWMHLRLGDA